MNHQFPTYTSSIKGGYKHPLLDDSWEIQVGAPSSLLFMKYKQHKNLYALVRLLLNIVKYYIWKQLSTVYKYTDSNITTK